MALIQCPECGKEISDQAASCPNCGYAINTAPKVIRTELGPVERSAGAGTMWICAGVITLLMGLFLISAIIGIFMIIGSFGMIGYGSSRKKGMQKGKCPYCGNEITVVVGNKTHKCTHCKKIMNQTADHLETVL